MIEKMASVISETKWEREMQYNVTGEQTSGHVKLLKSPG